MVLQIRCYTLQIHTLASCSLAWIYQLPWHSVSCGIEIEAVWNYRGEGEKAGACFEDGEGDLVSR